MSYIESNLMSNETIKQRAKIHWFIYVNGICLLVFTLIIGFAFPEERKAIMYAGFASAYFIIKAFIVSISTELGITNKRVIAKYGLIMRRTIELNLSKVESLTVDQGIFGRVFNFGKVTINGTGGIKAPFKYVVDPLAIRRIVNEEFEKATSNTTAAT